MIILDKALEQRAEAGAPVRIALVGAGFMARGIAARAQALRGVELVAVSNRTVEKAARLLEDSGRAPWRRVETVADLEEAIVAGAPAVSGTPDPLCRAAGVDVVIEATGTVEFGAHVAVDAIQHGKHLVLVNAELDSTVGPILKEKADQAGVIMTNTDGDEPGVAMNLLRYVRTIGLRPVLAGNVKGFLDRRRNPDTQRRLAAAVRQDAKRLASYADGTKLSMEAAILANASGLRVQCRGMRGIQCTHVREVVEFFDSDELLSGGYVDYVLGAEPGSGVFVVGYTDDPIAREYIANFKLGDGPFYVFYVPWHLPHADAPLTAARAVIFHDAAVAPAGAPVCDVLTIAKRDLSKGTLLDGSGGFTCYGVAENADVARRQQLLPMGLSEGCELLADVKVDHAITYEDVRLPNGRLADRLRMEQDARFR
jgi:predicted homoserine dehydrogenase-like protein